MDGLHQPFFDALTIGEEVQTGLLSQLSCLNSGHVTYPVADGGLTRTYVQWHDTSLKKLVPAGFRTEYRYYLDDHKWRDIFPGVADC